MENYNIYLSTAFEKYDLMQHARQCGAKITGVSGCGPGYYIQIDATAGQVDYINRNLYTEEIDSYTAAQAWKAWKAGRLTVGQLITWQERHNVIFDPAGNVKEAGACSL